MSEILIPKNTEGRDMSPIEARTGVVLPIWAPGEGRRNRHHAYFYRKPWMNGPRKIETRAVRQSRLQYVLMTAHNDGPRSYHRFFEGTEFPNQESQSFGITILNCANYIPPFVVDMTGSMPAIVETTPHMREKLLLPGILGLEKGVWARKNIGKFLMQHAVNQKFDHVRQSQVEQFIELGKPKYKEDESAQTMRLELGLRLANIGLGVAVNPIDKTYFQARDEHAVAPTAPVCAWQVAKNLVAGHEPEYFDDLEQNLLAQFA